MAAVTFFESEEEAEVIFEEMFNELEDTGFVADSEDDEDAGLFYCEEADEYIYVYSEAEEGLFLAAFYTNNQDCIEEMVGIIEFVLDELEEGEAG